jgi:hypothetical protein
MTATARRRSKAWLWPAGFLIVVGAAVAFLSVVFRDFDGDATGAEKARRQVLKTEAPALVREVEVANADPGHLGPASVALFRGRVEEDGDTVLGSGSTPGRPAVGKLAGWIDVRMVRTAPGTTLFWPGGSEEETTAICLRYETRWSDTDGTVYRFHEIDCP